MVNGKKIRVLTINLGFDISSREVPLLRGAVIANVGNENSTLFHNHTEGDKYRYSYPLIQYKRLGGQAFIMAFAEGSQTIGKLVSHCDEYLRLGDRNVRIEHFSIQQAFHDIEVVDQMTDYHLRCWLPFNEDNYERFRRTTTIVEQIQMLENIVRGNILSMCKGLGIFLEQEVKVDITAAEEPFVVRIKGIPQMAFNIDFRSNIALPDNIGLGKHVSIGCGIVTKKESKQKTK